MLIIKPGLFVNTYALKNQGAPRYYSFSAFAMFSHVFWVRL